MTVTKAIGIAGLAATVVAIAVLYSRRKNSTRPQGPAARRIGFSPLYDEPNQGRQIIHSVAV
jgi:hypothetical protein